MRLDLKDKRLIYELGLNSRQPTRELAKKLNLSKSSVNYRIQRLIKNKVITGFKTYINYYKLGISNYVLYLKFQNTNEEIESRIVKYFLSSNHVTWLGSSYGNWELIIELTAEDFPTLYSLLSNFYKAYSPYIQKKELVQCIFEDFFSYKFTNLKEYPALRIDFIGEKTTSDNIDKAIVTYITENPHYNLYKIALDLSISLDIVNYRIKKLTQNRIIAGHSIQLDLSSLGLGWYIFQVSLKNYAGENKFTYYLQKHPNVCYIYKYLGAWDYEIGLYIKSSEELENFVLALKSQFSEMIKDYEFSLVTKLHRFK